MNYPIKNTKRGRPKGSKAENAAGQQTRDILLKAALKLFSQHGFAGVSTAAIAAEAGVAKGAITHHFTNKRKLYSAVLERVSDGLRCSIEGAFKKELAKEQAISHLIDGVLAWGHNFPEQVRVLAYDLLELPQRDKGSLTKSWKLGPPVQQVMNLINEAKKQGVVCQNADTISILKLLFGMVTYHIIVQPYGAHILQLEPDADSESKFVVHTKRLLEWSLYGER